MNTATADNKIKYTANERSFLKIPNCPIAYWASDRIRDIFEYNECFTGVTKKGILTGNDEQFLRFWYEVCYYKITMSFNSYAEMNSSKYKWLPVTSGGHKRKWFGNLDTVVNLENEGYEIKRSVKNYRLRDPKYYFLEAITWTEVSSGVLSCRYVPSGILFGNGGPVSFFFNDKLKYTLGLLNSEITMKIMTYIAPTVNFGPEQVARVPVIIDNESLVTDTVNNNIELSKADWDSFETSWGFKKHPLI